jgi:hypothetical protein
MDVKIMENRDLDQELDNWKAVSYRMENEGIDYCFEHYSNWDEIEDEKFHKLRKEFLSSMKNIKEFVDNKINETETLIIDNF